MAAPVVCLIVAVAENGVIGRDGKMPWHLPSELKYFRERTMGKPVIMGRKTFQSVGKPLPGRANIVVTRDAKFVADGVTLVTSLEAALAVGRVAAAASGALEIMVIGGTEIYRQALPMAQRVYLTRIAVTPEGDATFAPLDPHRWRLSEERAIATGARDSASATAQVYDRVATTS